MPISCEDLIEQVIAYDPSVNKSLIKKAWDLAVQYHGSQKRESGDPYYQHPLEVASIIASMRLDINSIIAAILHDTIEDTDLTLEEIEEGFGSEVTKLVNGVTKLTKIEFQPDYIRQAENFRKLLLAMSDDIRVLIIKLADRLHNMRTIEHIGSEEKKTRIAIETMEIYAPLAERIGMQELKLELHDIAFKVLHSAIYSSIVTRLNEISENEHELIDEIISELKDLLEQIDVEFEISGRRKTPFSIWMKMKHKNVSFDQLADIMAFRIVVKDLLSCYKVLGIIHSSYQMIPDQFQDFISTPKNNGYQSLHTVIIGPKQRRIEIQIRTEGMHEVAEWGLAAHWSYKQRQSPEGSEGKQYKWIKDLLEILEQSQDPEEFLRNTKMAMHYDQVFCFTPKGELVALPVNSTPVDFAYMVHSDVGNGCVGAIINGKIAPLKTMLKNGDQVEIITSATGKPSSSWEIFVVTGRARSEIKKFSRTQRREEFLGIGKNMFDKELKAAEIDLDKVDQKKLLRRFGRHNIEDLYFAIGDGSISAAQVIEVILSGTKVKKDTENEFSILSFKKHKKSPEDQQRDSLVDIHGLVTGMSMHFAKCCHPILGDKIVGVVNTGVSVAVHTHDCPNVLKLKNDPERILPLYWNTSKRKIPCVSRLKVIVTNELGSLAFVTSVMAQSKVNILNFRIVNRNQDFFEILVDVEVDNQEQLDSVSSLLLSGKYVTLVERDRD